MPYFISEEEAVAIIDERMDEIVAKMASGSSGVSMAGESQTSPGGNQPCSGSCTDAADPGNCCNCCLC